MNTNGLARHYDTLTPWERLPLMAGALLREDGTELDRLTRSAPRLGFRIPDYWGLAEGMSDLVILYLVAQLDRAACYWRLMAFFEQGAQLGRRKPTHKKIEQALQMLAYRFVIEADAWRLLCSELHLDPVALLRGLPGRETLEQMDAEARQCAFSPAEANAYLREIVTADLPSDEAATVGRREVPPIPPDCRLDTAAEVARSMRKFLQQRLDSWQ